MKPQVQLYSNTSGYFQLIQDLLAVFYFPSMLRIQGCVEKLLVQPRTHIQGTAEISHT